MKQESVSMEEVMAKIKDIDRLPTYKETKQLLFFLENMSYRDYIQNIQKSWWGFCNEYGVHNVYNIEFMGALAEEIKKLNDSPIVEICAGDGKLSHQLRKQGIDIKATDDYSCGNIRYDTNLVERLSHQEALTKYNPRIVIASWVPYQARIGFDVLDFPSVKYFLDIGEDVNGATWMTEEIYDRKDCKRVYLKNVGKYSICRTDYPSGMFHSCVSLFRKSKTI